MHDLAAWAALVLQGPHDQAIALVSSPSRACVQDTCLDDPWDDGASVWTAAALDPEHATLRAGRSAELDDWRQWRMPVDLAVVAPRTDLAPLLARTVDAPGMRLRAGIPLEPIGRGRWRWAASGLAGEVALDPADVRDIVVVDAVPPVDGAIDFGAGVLRADPAPDGAVVATLTGCQRCAEIERESAAWVRVRIRTPLVDVQGWVEGRPPEPVFFEEGTPCGWPTGPSGGYATPGTAVAWTAGGPVIGRTTESVEFGLGWPAPWMPFTVRTPWGPLSLFAEHPEQTSLDRWFGQLRLPREGVLTSPDCARWDASPEPAVPGLVWFTCAREPQRRFGVARGDGESLSGVREDDGRIVLTGWLRVIRDHGGPTGLGSGRALARLDDAEYVPEFGILPVVAGDRVTSADVVAADVPPLWGPELALGESGRRVLRQETSGVEVRSEEASPGRWVDTLVEASRLDEFGIVRDDPLPRYVLPAAQERAVRIAFVGERSVSAYVAIRDAVRCVTFDRGSGARRPDVLVDEATGRTLRCVAEPGAVRVSPIDEAERD